MREEISGKVLGIRKGALYINGKPFKIFKEKKEIFPAMIHKSYCYTTDELASMNLIGKKVTLREYYRNTATYFQAWIIIEVLPVSQKARKSIESVKIWSM